MEQMGAESSGALSAQVEEFRSKLMHTQSQLDQTNQQFLNAKVKLIELVQKTHDRQEEVLRL